MSTGHFIVKAITDLNEAKVGDKFVPSDFASLTTEGKFVQLEYIEEKHEREKNKVRPGLWTIRETPSGLELEKTAFVSDGILADVVNIEEITHKIECFRRNLHKYKEFGIEIPRRSALIYGVAGTGKTTGIIKACNNYLGTNKVAAILWPTDKIDAGDVKDFVKTFEYVDVEWLILVAEDIGGVEIDQVRMKSTSSLLSLLDNKEKTFTIPIFIAATTNHPENFLGNLTNRPGRFDDKIHVGYPSGETRRKLLDFFAKGGASKESLDRVTRKEFNEFSAAHLQEAVIRSAIHEITLDTALTNILKEIEHYKNLFQMDKTKFGIGMGDD